MHIGQKKFADVLTGVGMVTITLKTPAVAHVVLGSSNVERAYDALLDSEHLRGQIEGNVRDAKQYWGLEDLMTVKHMPVYNRAHLAMGMVNVSHAVMHPMRTPWPEVRVTALKAWFRSRK